VSLVPSPKAGRLWIAGAIVAIPLVAYPLSSLAGGTPRFPSREDCIRALVEGHPIDLVYGHFDSPVDAASLLARVLHSGFTGTEALPDDCGRWRVVLEDVPSIQIGEEIQAEAATVDLHPRLELGKE